MNVALNGVSCFIAYMRYHGIMTYSEVKMTDANFIAVIQVANIDAYRVLFTTVERVPVSKKHGLHSTENTYKVYLNRVDLVKKPNVKLRKNGKPDMRYKGNALAAHQIKLNAFFGSTV